MFRVDQPAIAGVEETLTSAEWVGDVRAQAGSIVKRADIPAATVLIGSGSVYRMIPCDEATAMKAIRSAQHRPLMLVKLVETVAALGAGTDLGQVEFADEEDDLDDDEDREDDSVPLPLNARRKA
jgi:hypothetical protein